MTYSVNYKRHLARFIIVAVLCGIKFIPKYYSITKDNYPGLEKYEKNHASASEMLEQCPVRPEDGEVRMYVEDVYTYGAGFPIVIGVVQGGSFAYPGRITVETADHRQLEGRIQLINPPKPDRNSPPQSDKTAPDGKIAAIMLTDIDRSQVETGCIVRADKLKMNNISQRS